MKYLLILKYRYIKEVTVLEMDLNYAYLILFRRTKYLIKCIQANLGLLFATISGTYDGLLLTMSVVHLFTCQDCHQLPVSFVEIYSGYYDDCEHIALFVCYINSL